MTSNSTRPDATDPPGPTSTPAHSLHPGDVIDSSNGYEIIKVTKVEPLTTGRVRVYGIATDGTRIMNYFDAGQPASLWGRHHPEHLFQEQ